MIAEGVLQEEGDPLGGRLGLQLMPQSDFALRVGGAHLSDRWSLGGGFAAYSEASSLSYGLHWDQSWEHVVSFGGIFDEGAHSVKSPDWTPRPWPGERRSLSPARQQTHP